jgi:hypothetical protein
MFWILNAPIYGVHDNHEIVTFVENIYIIWCMFTSKRPSRFTNTLTQMHMSKKNPSCVSFPLSSSTFALYTNFGTRWLIELFDQLFTHEKVTKDLTKNCQKQFTILS